MIGTISHIILLTAAMSLSSAEKEQACVDMHLEMRGVGIACYSHEIGMLEIVEETQTNSWYHTFNKREMNSPFLAKQGKERNQDQTKAQQ